MDTAADARPLTSTWWVVAYRTGAVAYVIWGVMHAATGLSGLLPALSGDVPGALAALAALADRAPAQAGAALHPAITGLLQHHAFNLTWGGIFSAVVGAGLNWRNSSTTVLAGQRTPPFWHLAGRAVPSIALPSLANWRTPGR